MDDGKKRKSDIGTGEGVAKKFKGGAKQWRAANSQANLFANGLSIKPGDSGIWVTCDRGQEAKCSYELRDLFSSCAENFYGDLLACKETILELDGSAKDIEANIDHEIASLRQTESRTLFQPIKIDVKCVLFFRTTSPIDPVTFVHRICADAMQSTDRKRSRYIRRLTPITIMGKATEKGLGDTARVVLRPHFHEADSPIKKFAIRTTIRSHNVLDRNAVIKQVADSVGNPHKVDLTDYDLVILVDIYKNICGMSVVGADYDKLKRYNLSEIYSPSARGQKPSLDGNRGKNAHENDTAAEEI